MMDLPLLIVATRNAHKTQEIAQMLEGTWRVVDLSAYPETPFVEETGTTFLENATLKALSASRVLSGLVLADDSGLIVDALGGEPGVYSSSYGGVEGNHALNNERMIRELRGLAEKGQKEPFLARFSCTMVLAKEGEVLASFVGSVEGQMLSELSGAGGFGYDPLFVPEGYGQSFAELGAEVKNKLSHRARALEKVISFLQK